VGGFFHTGHDSPSPASIIIPSFGPKNLNFSIKSKYIFTFLQQENLSDDQAQTNL
jgi:hypothetical protein